MGWSIGYDHNWKRDVGYGVPAVCDHPQCNAAIDRGLAYVCGGEQPYGGDHGCGLYFCSGHLLLHHFRGARLGFYCKRCISWKPPYNPKPDVREWLEHKLTDGSWKEWRDQNPEEIAELRNELA